MRARASFRSHAIHQMLVPFPLAFLLAAFFFDLGGVLLDRPTFWTTSTHLTLAGVVAALVAAAPGLLDLWKTVPPESSARSRGIKHAVANVSATALFALALVLRPDSPVSPGAGVLAIEAVAAALLAVGGWMGGTLVVRNQIGVDHRYAGAGKWKERTVKADPEDAKSITVAAGDLETDQMMLLHVGGRRIVLGRTDGGLVAFEDRCTHTGGSLADGVLICGTVQCPWHGSQFDARTGKVKAGPAEKGIEAYRVEEKGKTARIIL